VNEEQIRQEARDRGRTHPVLDAGGVVFKEEELYIHTYAEPLVAEDVVNHPSHYTSHPSGVECIQITEHMGFNLGNALKYIWRADLKHDAIEDMKKAVFYLNREIDKREDL